MATGTGLLANSSCKDLCCADSAHSASPFKSRCKDNCIPIYSSNTKNTFSFQPLLFFVCFCLFKVKCQQSACLLSLSSAVHRQWRQFSCSVYILIKLSPYAAHWPQVKSLQKFPNYLHVIGVTLCYNIGDAQLVSFRHFVNSLLFSCRFSE